MNTGSLSAQAPFATVVAGGNADITEGAAELPEWHNFRDSLHTWALFRDLLPDAAPQTPEEQCAEPVPIRALREAFAVYETGEISNNKRKTALALFLVKELLIGRRHYREVWAGLKNPRALEDLQLLAVKLHAQAMSVSEMAAREALRPFFNIHFPEQAEKPLPMIPAWFENLNGDQLETEPDYMRHVRQAHGYYYAWDHTLRAIRSLEQAVDQACADGHIDNVRGLREVVVGLTARYEAWKQAAFPAREESAPCNS